MGKEKTEEEGLIITVVRELGTPAPGQASKKKKAAQKKRSSDESLTAASDSTLAFAGRWTGLGFARGCPVRRPGSGMSVE